MSGTIPKINKGTIPKVAVRKNKKGADGVDQEANTSLQDMQQAVSGGDAKATASTQEIRQAGDG